MKNTLFVRIAAAAAGVSAVVVLAGTGLSLYSVRSHYLRIFGEQVRQLTAGILADLEPQLRFGRTEQLAGQVRLMGERFGVRVTVVARDGTVLADSHASAEDMENHGDRPEVRSAFEGNPVPVVRTSATTGEDMLYFAQAWPDPTRAQGVVRVSVSMGRIGLLFSDMGRSIVLAGLLAFVFSLAVVFPVAHGLSGSVRSLADFSRKLAGGDWSARASTEGPRELRELAENLNRMGARIEELFAEIRGQRDRISGVLSAVQEGVLVMAEDGDIVAANPKAEGITGLSGTARSRYWEAVRDPAFTELMRSIEEGRREEAFGEVEISGRIYHCAVRRTASGEYTVASFHDISELWRMERMKSELVTNVSHELRTPLTVIQGYLEQLEACPADAGQARLIKVIGVHARRLGRIVEDLLLLSSLEDRPAGPEFSRVELGEVVRTAAGMFLHRAKERHLEMLLDLPERPVQVTGDAFMLQQVVVNLIDNALKYTVEGAVTIRLRTERGRVLLEVTDTGIGIAPEHLDRVFERFYVVDKARSRESGGTGLGLSIVKHIAILHGGSVRVRSVPGEGSTFTVELPEEKAEEPPC